MKKLYRIYEKSISKSDDNFVFTIFLIDLERKIYIDFS
jgi:hypothetical protein